MPIFVWMTYLKMRIVYWNHQLLLYEGVSDLFCPLIFVLWNWEPWGLMWIYFWLLYLLDELCPLLLAFFLYVTAHVCVTVYVFVHMRVGKYVYLCRGQRVISSLLLYHSPLYTFKRGFPSEPVASLTTSKLQQASCVHFPNSTVAIGRYVQLCSASSWVLGIHAGVCMFT